MREWLQHIPARERYRLLVSALIIPLGLIIVIRATLAGLEAWTLILLGLAFMGLGIVRLRQAMLYSRALQKAESEE